MALAEQTALAVRRQQEMDELNKVRMTLHLGDLHRLSTSLVDSNRIQDGPPSTQRSWRLCELCPWYRMERLMSIPCCDRRVQVTSACRCLHRSAQEPTQQRIERLSWQHLSCVCSCSWLKHRLNSGQREIKQRRG